jgi:hypothetical protein
MAPDFTGFFLYSLVAGVVSLACFCGALIWGIKRIVWWALRHSESLYERACEVHSEAARTIEESTRTVSGVCEALRDLRRSVDAERDALLSLIAQNAADHTEHARIMQGITAALEGFASLTAPAAALPEGGNPCQPRKR